MWLFTPRGFFSAVQKPGDAKDEMLTIRARDKADLEGLADLLPDAEPYAKQPSDYPWRIRVPQKDWAMAVARMALEIDYVNFKDEVKKTQGGKRAGTYSRVWSAMLEVDPSHASYKPSWSSSWKAEPRKWKKGDRAWDSVLHRAATVRSNGKELRVHYDGDAPDVSVIVEYPEDLRTLWAVGDKVYDTFKRKRGTITSMRPLELEYDDGTKSTKPFLTDLRRPEDVEQAVAAAPGTQMQLPAGGSTFADQQESSKQRKSKGKRGSRRK